MHPAGNPVPVSAAPDGDTLGSSALLLHEALHQRNQGVYFLLRVVNAHGSTERAGTQRTKPGVHGRGAVEPAAQGKAGLIQAIA